ncbi:MAG TPA: hypothetical protein K8V56_03360 [Sporosarcina psychrophila]|uniref:Uncharacterized protein n=1 Tax=Sporosarcina psychrophila TaxID=1476 RepID=A0A921FW37_SPOPS|nr:hypothetical protein [Sporosarcina psychrophila]
MKQEELQKIWKALSKYGIYTEEELNTAIKQMKPLNIGCMVSPVKKFENEKTVMVK